MTKLTTVTAGELRKRHGQRVRLETPVGVIIEDGIISVDGSGWVGLAHNNPDADGTPPDEMFGKHYGRCLYTSADADDHSNNYTFKWLEFLDDAPKTDKAYIVTTIYSDGVEIRADGNITIDGVTKTRTKWQEYQKKIRRAVERRAA